jgi:hypothetical protein
MTNMNSTMSGAEGFLAWVIEHPTADTVIVGGVLMLCCIGLGTACIAHKCTNMYREPGEVARPYRISPEKGFISNCCSSIGNMICCLFSCPSCDNMDQKCDETCAPICPKNCCNQ